MWPLGLDDEDAGPADHLVLMLVFGAGASYDSCPDQPEGTNDDARVPLSDGLFGPVFAPVAARWKKLDSVLPYLRYRPNGWSVERALEELQAEAAGDPYRIRQLMAVRYYIHFAGWEAQRRWVDICRRVTNYTTLFDELRRLVPGGEEISIVTFNYDTMVEHALESQYRSFADVASYVSDQRWNVYKVHGSINWARTVEVDGESWENQNAWAVGETLIERAPDLRVTPTFLTATEHPIGFVDGGPCVPAVAIPMERKQDFECPADQIERLRTVLPKVTRLLVIGWRATDEPFLGLLREARPQVERLVSVNRNDPVGPVSRLRDAGGIRAKGEGHTGGFTTYVVNRRVRELYDAA